MIKRKTILIITAVLMLAACKKNYTCQCTNSNGTYDAGEIEATKNQAKKHCESLSGGSTTCKLK